MESLKKAVNRGVKLSIITRLDLEGDTIDYILSEVNKNDVNRFFKRGEVLEFVAPKNILHSKIVLIDKKLSIVGSVNLNQRSFFHDTENSLMIWSGDFYNTMNNVLESYSKDNKSRKITEKLKTNFWKQIVIKAFAKEL